MFNYNNFNNNFDDGQNFSPYDSDSFGMYNKNPYIQGMSVPMPQPLAGNLTATNLYPLESSTATPGLSVPLQQRYARGGRVSRNSLPGIAEFIRRQGGGGDTILAHINPEEAAILGQTTGGDINPITGLPQYGLFNKPWKAIKSSVGKVGGAVIGNMILPGIGGIIGGALGGGTQNALRGKKFGEGALQGAITGATLPSLASIGGAGASALGFSGLGSGLSSYGAQNAILPAIGRMFPSLEGVTGTLSGFDPFSGGSGGMAAGDNGGGGVGGLIQSANLANLTPGSLSASAGGAQGLGSIGSLGSGAAANSGSSSWLSSFMQPRNLLAAASLAGNFIRPKEDSPEKKAAKEKRYLNAMRPSMSELQADEQVALEKERARRRIERNKFLPEERFAIQPIYRKENTPEEYKRRGRWIEYYNNPEFAGTPMANFYKEGGRVEPQVSYEIEEIDYPSGVGRYFQGDTKGQDDEIDAKVSHGEYVLPADVVAHVGDGNNEAGGKQFDRFVAQIRKAKGQKNQLPPKLKHPLSYYLK